MNSSKFWFASALLLVVVVGVVLGATSTTTTPSSTTTTSKRPVGKRNSTTTTTTTTTRTTTTRKPKKSSNSTSTRVVRDTNTHGIIGSIGHDQDQDQRFGLVKVNTDNNSTKNKNHTSISQTRLVRSSLDEDQHDQGNKGNSADSPSSPSSDDSSLNSSHVFVPSNHPLFATRTSSNVTDSLRPKLRTSPVVKSGQKQVSVDGGLDDTSSVESSSSENTDTKNHNHRRQPSPSVKVSSTSSEESVSTVVSSGPVPIGGGVVGTGRNSSVKGFASGSINNRRPVPHKNNDEDALLFV